MQSELFQRAKKWRRQTAMARISLATIAVVAASQYALAQSTTTSTQGVLRTQGVPFDGIAHGKFAIVTDAGATTLWSNDGSSVAGDEPATFVDFDVRGGVYQVLLGAPPMDPLVSDTFAGVLDAALRAWFDTGSGFEQMPDQPFGATPFAQVCEQTNQIGANMTSFVPVWNGNALVSGSIFDNGFVGIGTSSPAAPLDVAGAIAINGQMVVNQLGEWVGEPGVGPPGVQGPPPDHEWLGTQVRFELADGSFGPFVDLRGPAPAHQWSGTSVRFMNPDGTWGPFVNLQGPQGPPGPTITTFANCGIGSSCGSGYKVVANLVAPCQVTSDVGPCMAETEGSCTVCAPQ